MPAIRDAETQAGPAPRCTARYDTGQCPRRATPGLPVCGPCLTLILNEQDPQRRRSLASLPRLPRELIQHLANDPDPGVRARVATREDLDPDLSVRFADPGRESSPVVWRALAATRTVARHATMLAGCDDHLTLLVLATNPDTPDEVLTRLAATDDPTLTATVEATRHGSPPDDAVISQVLSARSIPTRSLSNVPEGSTLPGDGAPPSDPERPKDAPDDERPASRRGLVAGFVAVVVAILIAVVVTLTVGGGPTRTVQKSGSESTTTSGNTAVTTRSSTTPATSTTAPATTTSAPADPDALELLALDITMTAKEGRFCDEADLTIDYDAEGALVVIFDDADRELYSDAWPPGATRTIELQGPTRYLRARLTTEADPDTFKPSGSVSGNIC